MVKRILILVSIWTMVPSVLFAAQVFRLGDDTPSYALGKGLDVLEDRRGEMTIEDVTSKKIDKLFRPCLVDSPNFGFTDSAYWARFTVENKTDRAKSWLLALEYPHLDHIEFYSPTTGGRYAMQEAGDLAPFAQREIRHRYFLFPLEIPADRGPRTYYMRFESRGPVQFPLTILSGEEFLVADHKEQFALGIYYGIMLVMALYNFFIFFSVRDKSYLYYVLYIVSYALVQMTYNGLAFEWLWPCYPRWANVAMPFLIGLSLFCILQFSKSFLNTEHYTPFLHKVFRVLSYVVTVPMFLSFFWYALGLRLALISMILVAAIIVCASISTFRKGYRPARYYLIAWLAFISGFVLIVLRTFGVLPNVFLTEYGIQIGSAMEVTLLSLGLADRINQERKEKFEAQKNALEAKEEAVKNLEKASRLKSEFLAITERKVEERTRELNETLMRVEEANRHIMESLRYARMIQNSLLPSHDEIARSLSDHFVIWRPRDIVGGDIFFFDFFDDGFIAAVVDCTGHGAPGAFMTMIASSALKRIIRDEERRMPGDILKRLNFIVKTTLQQDTDHAVSDDGLDAAVCYFQLSEKNMVFAGARLHLICQGNEELKFFRGDRQSIGYKGSDFSYEFSERHVALEKGMCFYMNTDGFTDQLGGPKGISFGRRRFVKIVAENHRKPFEEQKKLFLEAFYEYKGDLDRLDDVTVVGFKI